MTSTDIFSCSRGVERIFQNTVYRKLCVRSGVKYWLIRGMEKTVQPVFSEEEKRY
jgi:hypothetical protein